MSQHDQVLAQITALLNLPTTDRVVSGYTGHYLPNGKYFYVGTPKSDGPVKITTNVVIPDRQPSWMPRGSVRSAFISTDQDAILAMVAGLQDNAVQAPARKAPTRIAATPTAVPTPPPEAPKNPLLDYATDEELETLAPLPS